MSTHIHVATKYDVEFQEVYVDCPSYSGLIWELDDKAHEMFLTNLVIWNNEDENMFELDRTVLEYLAAKCPEYRKTINQWLSLSPESNDFVRIEIY